MSGVIIAGNTSGSVTLDAPAVAGSTVITLPSTSGTMALSGGAGSFTTVVASSTIKGASTIAVGNATPSASGAGITFPATQSASTDANTLDDYEEGTWTPILADHVSQSNAATMSVQEGWYSKIGNVVNLQAQVVWSGLGSMSSGNYIRIWGVPFTAATNSSQYYWPANLTASNSASNLIAGLEGNSVKLYFCATNNPGTVLTVSTLSASGRLLINATYRVS
jgi:hypothetical protein